MTTRTKTRPSLPELQARANAYAVEVFGSTSFHLPEDHAKFQKAADVIIAALVSAWAAGYAAGRE